MQIGNSAAQLPAGGRAQTSKSDEGTSFDKAKADVQAQRDDGQVKLEYDISKGTLSVDPGRPDKPPYEMKATSGKGECMNDPSCADKPWEGPVPPGEYTLNTDQISDPGTLKDWARNGFGVGLGGDWGDFRVPIKPDGDTKTHGRDGFFIHGGEDPGSAGCIDVGGGTYGDSQTDQFLEDIKGDANGEVELVVVEGEGKN